MSRDEWGRSALASLVEDAIGGLWGSAPDTTNSDDEDVLVLRGADFRNWDSRRAADAAPRRVASRSLPRRLLRPGDLVLEVSGGSTAQPVGRVLVIDDQAVDGADKPLITSNFCRKLRLKDGVDPFFVKRQLDWLYGSGHTERFQTSTTNIRNLQVDDFLQGTSIVLPDHAQQVQVVALLDRVDDKRAGCSTHIAAARRSVERFRQAVLRAAYSGRLTADWREAHSVETEGAESLTTRMQSDVPDRKKTEKHVPLAVEAFDGLPEDWRSATGWEAFPFVTSGSRGWAKYYSDSGALFLRVGNLDSYSVNLDLNEVQHIHPPANAEAKRTRVQPNDLLISITAEIGMVGVVPDGLGDAYVNQHVAIARPHSAMNSRFLAVFVAAPSGGQAQLDTLKRGATKAGLGLDDIRSLVIPVPSAAEQTEIVDRVERLFALADSLQDRIGVAERLVDRSSQAVLAKAFRGDLRI